MSGAGNPSLRAEDLVRVHPWHIEEEVSMGAMHVREFMSLDGVIDAHEVRRRRQKGVHVQVAI
jgi:hypothetical protein